MSNKETTDNTAIYEESPNEQRQPLLAAFRQRQKKGQNEPPTKNDWGEFDVKIQGGRKVTVVYDPSTGDTVHFEFHGPISETGYLSHFVDKSSLPKRKIAKIAQQLAMEFAEKYGKQSAKNGGNQSRGQPVLSIFRT